MKKSLAAVGLAAGLLTGGAAGALVATPGLGGAQEEIETPAEDGNRPEPGTHLRDALAPLVEDGTITQEQSDAVVATLLDALPEHPRGGPGRFGRGFPVLRGAADAIGIDPEDLGAALRDGQSIADVANQQGVDPQAVVDALVAELEERLAERVDDGDLSQEEADAKLADAQERVDQLVHRDPPQFGGDDAPDAEAS